MLDKNDVQELHLQLRASKMLAEKYAFVRGATVLGASGHGDRPGGIRCFNASRGEHQYY